jgi:hypothetical protein
MVARAGHREPHERNDRPGTGGVVPEMVDRTDHFSMVRKGLSEEFGSRFDQTIIRIGAAEEIAAFGDSPVRDFRAPLCRAVVSLIAKTMRAKRGLLEDGSAELGERDEPSSRIVFADTTSGARELGTPATGDDVERCDDFAEVRDGAVRDPSHQGAHTHPVLSRRSFGVPSPIAETMRARDLRTPRAHRFRNGTSKA